MFVSPQKPGSGAETEDCTRPAACPAFHDLAYGQGSRWSDKHTDSKGSQSNGKNGNGSTRIEFNCRISCPVLARLTQTLVASEFDRIRVMNKAEKQILPDILNNSR